MIICELFLLLLGFSFSNDLFIKEFLVGTVSMRKHRLIELSDGRFLAAGNIDYLGAYDVDVALTMLQVDGKTVEYVKRFGGGGTDTVEAVCPTTDGFFSDGTLKWAVTMFGEDNDGNYDVTETSDGGLVIVGVTPSFIIPDLTSKPYLMKFDENGNYVFGQIIEGIVGLKVVEASTGHLITVGYTIVPGQMTNIQMTKLNSDGSHVFTKIYGGSIEEEDRAFDVIETSEGDFLLTGYVHSVGSKTRQELFVLKVNDAGSKIWAKSYSRYTSLQGDSLNIAADGSIIVSGLYYNQKAFSYLLKLSSTGEVQQSKIFGPDQPGGGTYCSNLLPFEDGYLLGGSSGSFTPGRWNLFTAKFDEHFEGCYYTEDISETVYTITSSLIETTAAVPVINPIPGHFMRRLNDTKVFNVSSIISPGENYPCLCTDSPSFIPELQNQNDAENCLDHYKAKACCCEVSYAIDDESNPNNYFTIDNETGLVDARTGSNMPDGEYTLNITAFSRGAQKYAVGLFDVTMNVYHPYFTPPIATHQVLEVCTPLNIDVYAREDTSDGCSSGMVYQLNDTVNFKIFGNSYLKSKREYLPVGVYPVRLSVMYGTGLFIKDFIITIQDTQPPVWNETIMSKHHHEVFYNHRFEYKVEARNPQDCVDNVTYSINDTTNFEIDANTGWIRNKTELIQNRLYPFQVSASDGHNIITSDFTVFVVSLDFHWVHAAEDQNVNVCDEFSYSMEASFGGNPIVYTISDDVNFDISVEGLITNGAVDLLPGAEYPIQINATSGGLVITDEFTVDVTSNPPTWIEKPESGIFEIQEGSGSPRVEVEIPVRATTECGPINYQVNDTTNFVIENHVLKNKFFHLEVGTYDLEVSAENYGVDIKEVIVVGIIVDPESLEGGVGSIGCTSAFLIMGVMFFFTMFFF